MLSVGAVGAGAVGARAVGAGAASRCSSGSATLLKTTYKACSLTKKINITIFETGLLEKAQICLYRETESVLQIRFRPDRFPVFLT
jgi:hypothetical protein